MGRKPDPKKEQEPVEESAVNDEIDSLITGKLPKMPDSIKRKMIRVQGNRLYLQVQDRLIWFRHEFPEWGVESEILNVEVTGVAGEHIKGYCIARGTVRDDQGRIRGQGIKSETSTGFADFIEKACTGAIGRALAVAGFGTQFTGEEFNEGGRIVDSPAPRGVTNPVPDYSGERQQQARVAMNNPTQDKRAKIEDITKNAILDLCTEQEWDADVCARNALKKHRAVDGVADLFEDEAIPLLKILSDRAAKEAGADD
jgi:hypothetical protein